MSRSLYSIADDIGDRIEGLKNGTRFKKADWIKFLENLKKQIQDADDRMHEDCYSGDQIHDFVSEELEERERQKQRDLQRTDPEEHRSRFGVIQGEGAA